MNFPVAIRDVQAHGWTDHAFGPHGHELAQAAQRAFDPDAAGLAHDAACPWGDLELREGRDVAFLGYVRDAQLPDLYQRCRVLPFAADQFDMNFRRAPDLLGLLPTAGLLGSARRCLAGSAGAPPDSDPAGGGVGAENLVERHVFGRLLDLDDSRLTRSDSACQFVLGQSHGLTLPPDRQGRLDTKVQHLPFFVRQGQEVGGIPEFPSGRFQRFSFFGAHNSESS
jgi:hypothetical protein